MAEKYANLLGIDAIWLLTGKGHPYTNPSTPQEQSASPEEFIKMLQFEGNKEISLPAHFHQSMPLHEVNPLLFYNICVSVIDALKEFGIKLTSPQAAKKVVEIYEDITQASGDIEDQLKMVTLSVKAFKRTLQEIAKKDGKEVTTE